MSRLGKGLQHWAVRWDYLILGNKKKKGHSATQNPFLPALTPEI